MYYPVWLIIIDLEMTKTAEIYNFRWGILYYKDIDENHG